mgnify:FL=1
MTTSVMCAVAKTNINDTLKKVSILGFKYECTNVIDSGEYLTVQLNKLKRNQVVSSGETAIDINDLSNKYEIVKKCIW